MAGESARDASRLFLPVGTAVAITVAAITFHMYLSSQFNALMRRLDRIEDQANDRWTATDMRIWTLELGRKNPTLDVPPPAARPRGSEGR